MRRRPRTPLVPRFVPLVLALLACARPGPLAAQVPTAAADSAWVAGDSERAFALYSEVLAQDSTNAVALRRVALLLAERGRYDAALRLLERLLALDPQDRGAAIARARVLAGRGDLVTAEARWRELRAQDTTDLVVMAGLARTLRWQGRDAAARELLRHALPPLPAEVELAEELRANRVAIRPHAQGHVRHQRDSEQNRVTTWQLTADWRPVPRARLDGEGWLRALRDDTLEARVLGAAAAVWLQREPGWNFAARLGASDSDVMDSRAFLAASMSVTSPLRERAGGRLELRTAAFDVNALTVVNEVRATETVLDGWYRTAHWRIDAALGVAALHGRVSGHENTRRTARIGLIRPVTPELSLGARVHALGHDDASADGYFSPKQYTLGELLIRYGGSSPRWRLTLDASPGAQRVGSGPVTGSWRASGRAAYRPARGREVGLYFAAERSAADALAARFDPVKYGYLEAGITASWSF